MKTPLLLLLACGIAQAEDCKSIKDDAARLKCWDAQASEPGKPAFRDPKEFPFGDNTGPLKEPPSAPGFIVRDKMSGPYEDGKAVSLSLTTSNDDRILKTNAAVMYNLGNEVFSRDWQRKGWSTWVGVQWTKDANRKKPVDGRLARLAALGLAGDDIPVQTMVALEFSQDNVAKSKTFGLRPEFTPVILNVTEKGTPYSEAGAYSVYLKFGAQIDQVRQTKANQEVSGGAGGLNLKTSLNYYPGGELARLRLFLDAVRARDLYAASEIGKRSSTYYDFGAEWLFTRPDQKAGAVAPTLGLHRTIGDNFLTGTARSVQTVVSFGLKIN